MKESLNTENRNLTILRILWYCLLISVWETQIDSNSITFVLVSSNLLLSNAFKDKYENVNDNLIYTTQV